MSSEPRVLPTPQPPFEPSTMLDFSEARETYGVDVCQGLYQNPHSVFAYWEVTAAGIDDARNRLGTSADGSRLVLRMVSRSGPDQERHDVHDVDLLWQHGRRYLSTPRPGAEVRLAVGLVSREGYFAPIAQSALLQLPDAEPADLAAPISWMQRSEDGTIRFIAGVSERRLSDDLLLFTRNDTTSAYLGYTGNGSGQGGTAR